MNGDSKQIVKLLADRIDDLSKQINLRFDDFQKNQDDIKQYVEEKHNSQQTQINNHCPRIRALEKYKNTVGGIVIAVAFSISSIWAVITYLTK